MRPVGPGKRSASWKALSMVVARAPHCLPPPSKLEVDNDGHNFGYLFLSLRTTFSATFRRFPVIATVKSTACTSGSVFRMLAASRPRTANSGTRG